MMFRNILIILFTLQASSLFSSSGGVVGPELLLAEQDYQNVAKELNFKNVIDVVTPDGDTFSYSKVRHLGTSIELKEENSNSKFLIKKVTAGKKPVKIEITPFPDMIEIEVLK